MDHNYWSDYEKELREYIYITMRRNSVDMDAFDNNTELIQDKVINSLLLITLISGIEDILNLRVVNDEVGLEDFSTVNKMINSAHRAYTTDR